MSAAKGMDQCGHIASSFKVDDREVPRNDRPLY
jgi:hypothetical protein